MTSSSRSPARCRDHPGTSLEFIPGTAVRGFTEDRRDVKLLADMSREARAPINWNTVLLDYPGMPDIQDRQLDAVAEVAEMGGFVVPQIIPHNFRVGSTCWKATPASATRSATPSSTRWTIRRGSRR